MGRVLPKKLQISKIAQLLRKHGIEPDTVDLYALVDDRLTYNENRENILRMLGKRLREIDYLGDEWEIRMKLEQALMWHNTRSPRSIWMDDRKVAKIPKNPDTWYKAPNRYDLPDVDDPLHRMTKEEYVRMVLERIRKRKEKERKSLERKLRKLILGK